LKRILIILIGLILITGCTSTTDHLKKFKDTNSKYDTYELSGTMKIINNEDEFTYNITVGVKDNEYYKVSLINTLNDHEQYIIRNDDGVYVVTPSLNKSFKFMSEWPSNSSQAYLIGNLLDDVNKNNKATIEEADNGYIITTTVNYPNNPKLVKETINIDENYNIKSVNIMDEDDNILMNVEFKNINYNPKFSSDYFELDITDTDTSDCSTCSDTDTDTETTSNILEDIVYPLYVPADTYLSSKDNVETSDGNRIILTFAGVDPFILVEEVSSLSNEMEIIPVSGEPLQIGSTIGALSDNSLYFSSDGIDYYLTSSTLSSNEMITIAESITNSANLVAGVK
jgi:outer membrane lipoprotein-sorting protein